MTTAAISDDPNSRYPLIPEEELESGLAMSSLPKFYKYPNKETPIVHEMVSRIKAAGLLGQPFLDEWQALREILGRAAAEGKHDVWDDLAKAWDKALPDHHRLLLTGNNPAPAFGGNYKPLNAYSLPGFARKIQEGKVAELISHEGKSFYLEASTSKTLKREPKAWQVLDCIKRLQWRLRRVPSKQEIIVNFAMNSPDVSGICDNELSRQLKKLGLKGRIPPHRFVKSLPPSVAWDEEE